METRKEKIKRLLSELEIGLIEHRQQIDIYASMICLKRDIERSIINNFGKHLNKVKLWKYIIM